MKRFSATFSNTVIAFLLVSTAAYATSFNNGALGSLVRGYLNNLLLMQYNVKDYGAIGNGVADDTPAIQSAINAAAASGLGTGGSTKGGIVYFPAGVYKTIAPLTNNTTASSRIIMRCEGKASTVIGGSFSGYVIDQNEGNIATIEGVENCRIKNTNTNITDQTGVFTGSITANLLTITAVTSGTIGIGDFITGTGITAGTYVSVRGTGTGGTGTYTVVGTASASSTTITSSTTNGAIRFNNSVGGFLRNLFVQGQNGLDLSSNATQTMVSGLDITGLNGATGSVGVYATEVGIYNTSITGWDEAVRATNAGFVCSNCRLEVNKTGFLLGKDKSGNSNILRGFSITGGTMERNNVGINLLNAEDGIISGMLLTGISDVAGSGFPTTGISIAHVSYTMLTGIGVNMNVSSAAWDLSGVSSNGGIIIAGSSGGTSTGTGGGVKWIMPTAAGKQFVTLINSNNDLTNAFPFANLPASPVEGAEYNITNCSIAGSAWGGVVTGGGAVHCKVRWNSTAWTAMGE